MKPKKASSKPWAWKANRTNRPSGSTACSRRALYKTQKGRIERIRPSVFFQTVKHPPLRERSFVDSSTPFQDRNPALIRAAQAGSKSGGHSSFAPPAWLFNVALIVGVPRLLGRCTGEPGPDATLKKLRAEDICRLRTAAFSEVEDFDLSSQQTVSSRSFGTLPILIISRDPAKQVPAKPSQAELDRRNAWGQMQDDLKNLSTRSRRIIAKK
jgi:hypothetical protein